MTEIHSPWQVTVYALIAHPTEAKVLILPTETGYALPWFDQAQEEQWLKQQLALEKIAEASRADLFLLRYVLDRTLTEERRVDALMEFELLSPTSDVSGEWIGAGALAQIPLAQPIFRTQIEGFLAEKASGSTPSLRAPWSRTGWYTSMRGWVNEELAKLDDGAVERTEIVRTWALSCVLRVITTTGQTLYFKATIDIPLFGNEGPVTAELARHFPGEVPQPLVVDGARRWMLMAPFEKDADQQPTLEHRLRLMRTHAALQVQSSGFVDDLLASGCLDRRLDWTADQIDPLFADEEFLKLNDDEIARLRDLSPILKERCRQIAAYNVPMTLVHGDLHTGNVAFRADGLTLFDWTDACIAHPFVDMLDTFWEKDEAIQRQLLDAYLAAWTVFAPLDQLHELWRLIQPILALHHLLSYHSITRHIEPMQRQDLAGMIPILARKILEIIGNYLPLL